MSLLEHNYSALIVSASAAINEALGTLMPRSRYAPVHTAGDLSTAKRCCADRTYDLVIINSPLPDDAGIRFAIDLCHDSPAAVLLLVPSDAHEEIRERVLAHGVFTLPRPLSKNMLSLALHWMLSARERFRKTERQTLSIEEKMKEIRLVNRAKWLLISELQMTEPEAHRYIEKKAMDESITRKEVAGQIIRTYAV